MTGEQRLALINRRSVLALLGGGAVLAAGGVGVLGLGRDDGPSAGPGATPADEALVAIGTRYLELVPEDRDIDRLVADLGLDLDRPGDPGAAASELDELSERIAADFEAGRTVAVDGWQLSMTEARLTALIALVAA